MSRVLRIFAVASLALIYLLMGSFTASAQQSGLVVEGIVSNETDSGSDVGGLTVTLHLEGIDPHDHLETLSDAEGRFRFEDIEFDSTVVYGVSTRYQGALYGVDVDLSQGSPPPLTISVFEAMSDDDVLYAGSVSMLFAGANESDETISVMEIVQLVNDSDRTYVPGPEPMNLVRFGLPPGATDLSVDTRLPGTGIAQVDRGFALVGSIPPGEHEIMFTYRFPYEGNEFTLVKSLRYGATDLRVLAPHELLSVSSDQLSDPEDVLIGERSYQLVQASDLPLGSSITLKLEGLPQSSLLDRFSNSLDAMPLEYSVPIGLSLFLATLTVFAVWRRRSPEMELVESFAEPDDEQYQRLAITEMISKLEREFRIGSLGERDYLRRRRILESRLAGRPSD